MAEQVPVLHVEAHVFPETIVAAPHELILQLMREKFSFAFHQAPNEVSIDNYRDVEIGPTVGYNEPHLLPYLSDPTGIVPGALVMINGELIHMEKAPALQYHYDRYLWGQAQDHYFAPTPLTSIIEGFVESGMPLKQYRPGTKDNTFIYRPNDVAGLDWNSLHDVELKDITGE